MKCGSRPPGENATSAVVSGQNASVACSWRCMQCGFDNTKGDHCEMCRQKKGFWRCGTCDFDVFANKAECRKCGTKRPINGSRASSSGVGSGKVDEVVAWKCPNCDAGQPDASAFCSKCGSSRAGEGGTERCVVCMDGPQDTLLKHPNGEGHKCVCMSCANVLMGNGDSCPMCRAQILEIVRVF